MDNVIARLRAVVVTLNKIEVKGRDNLDCLLASIVATDKSADELTRIAEAHAKEMADLHKQIDDQQAKLKAYEDKQFDELKAKLREQEELRGQGEEN